VVGIAQGADYRLRKLSRRVTGKSHTQRQRKNMANISHSECRKCGKTIHWHKSKAGKSYPTDSATDLRAFHECVGPEAKPQAKNPPPITPDYFEATLEQRVAALEKQLAQLSRTVQAVQARQPISSEDIGF
jgi:hypothetical protein